MCKTLAGDVWSLTVHLSFEGLYFAVARVYSTTRRTEDVYLREGTAFERGLEVLLDLAEENGVVLDELVEVGDDSLFPTS